MEATKPIIRDKDSSCCSLYVRYLSISLSFILNRNEKVE